MSFFFKKKSKGGGLGASKSDDFSLEDMVDLDLHDEDEKKNSKEGKKGKNKDGKKQPAKEEDDEDDCISLVCPCFKMCEDLCEGDDAEDGGV